LIIAYKTKNRIYTVYPVNDILYAKKLFYKFQSCTSANTPWASSRQQGSARIRHVVDIWSISPKPSSVCRKLSFANVTRLWSKGGACRLKMLSDSRDGLSPQRIESIEFIILATLTIAHTLFSRRGEVQKHSKLCVLVKYFYFKSIFVYQRVSSRLRSSNLSPQILSRFRLYLK